MQRKLEILLMLTDKFSLQSLLWFKAAKLQMIVYALFVCLESYSCLISSTSAWRRVIVTFFLWSQAMEKQQISHNNIIFLCGIQVLASGINESDEILFRFAIYNYGHVHQHNLKE